MAKRAYNYKNLLLYSAITILFALTALSASYAGALKAPEHRSFSSPQQAVAALVSAVQNNNDAELLHILGPGSEDLISSGDSIADQKGKARFLKAYKKKNNLEQKGEGHVVLLVGTKDYPFPIPIVRQGKAWVFDTQAGREEILDRRIGRNELHTIEVMHAYTDAQREYACMKRKVGEPEFAQKFTSSEGKKDGLYWKTNDGEEESPFGPMIAMATKEGYTGGLGKDRHEPFHGYYFKILKTQGQHAKGGAFDYVAHGKMILGFALVAYPAKYRASGVMTFIVNQEGVIYEKDLGEDTALVAAAMSAFDPDKTWRKYEEPSKQ